MIVFYNGSIYSEGEIKSALVVKDKKIKYVGEDETAKAMAAEAKASGSVRVVDLQGRLMLPGFVDSHAHPARFDASLEGKINVTGLGTGEEILREIRSYVQQNPDRDFYLGAGWAAPVFGDEGPTKEMLDEIVSDRPMVLTGVEGHTLWANSKAIEMAGITDDTPQPEGGVIEKNSDGTVRGSFKEEAQKPLLAIMPEPDIETVKTVIKKYQKKMVQAGCTASAEMMMYKNDVYYNAYMELAENDELIMKAGLTSMITPDLPAEEFIDKYAKPDRKVYNRVIHDYFIKIFVDGVVEGHTAWLKEPYEDVPGFCGDPIWDHDKLFRLALELDKMGYHFHLHAIGDRAAQEVADFAEYLQANNPRDDRIVVLAHAEMIAPEDIIRLGKLGVSLSTDPYWFGDDTEYHEEFEIPYLGEERAAELYPMKSLFDAGIVVSAASDYNITPYPHPLLGIAIACKRAFMMPDGTFGNSFNLKEKVTIRQMIEALTVNGYYSLGVGDRSGRLIEGMDADLVVLSDNILEWDEVDGIDKVAVEMTVSEGDIVYEGAWTIADAFREYDIV